MALVGLLRFHGNRGGKHVLSTFARKTITIILVNDQYLSDLKSTFQIDKYCNNLILFFDFHQDNYGNICQKGNQIKQLERSIQTTELLPRDHD